MQPISQQIYIIAGPNGAGKTTFAEQFLPSFVECREFLNADLIAAGLSPFAPEKQNVRAAELLLERIQLLVSTKSTFSFETTLSARSYAQSIPEWQKQGYTITMFFLWLPNQEMAVERVANRVRQGGHSILESVIRRRYDRGLSNLVHLYLPLVNKCFVYDASASASSPIFRSDGETEVILNHLLWQKITNQARSQ